MLNQEVRYGHCENKIKMSAPSGRKIGAHTKIALQSIITCKPYIVTCKLNIVTGKPYMKWCVKNHDAVDRNPIIT